MRFRRNTTWDNKPSVNSNESAMISITEHALDHFLGRCGHDLPGQTRNEQKRALEAIVEAGRMATRDEAGLVSQFLLRVRGRHGQARHAFGPDSMIVSDDHQVVFVVALDGQFPTVTTAVPLGMARRHCGGSQRRLRDLSRPGKVVEKFDVRACLEELGR